MLQPLRRDRSLRERTIQWNFPSNVISKESCSIVSTSIISPRPPTWNHQHHRTANLGCESLGVPPCRERCGVMCTKARRLFFLLTSVPSRNLSRASFLAFAAAFGFQGPKDPSFWGNVSRQNTWGSWGLRCSRGSSMF